MQKNSSHTLYCKTSFFFHHHQVPRQSSTVQVRRVGRGDNCVKKIFLRIIIIINNNDKRNKNISNRQTQSPQYKTRFCHGHNNQRKVFFFPLFFNELNSF